MQLVNFETEISHTPACQGLSGRYGTQVWWWRFLSVTFM